MLVLFSGRVTGGLRSHVPVRPECTTPYSVPVRRPAFELGFLQTSPHGDAPALLLTFGSAKTCWHEDFHLASSVPCPAPCVSAARDFLRVRLQAPCSALSLISSQLEGRRSKGSDAFVFSMCEYTYPAIRLAICAISASVKRSRVQPFANFAVSDFGS